MKERYPILENYCRFILDNQLDTFVQEVINIAEEERISILNKVTNLSKEQLFDKTREELKNELLIPMIKGTPFSGFFNNIKYWKVNKLIIPRNQLDLQDIIGLYRCRKIALIRYLKIYDCNKEEASAILEELENFYSSLLETSYLTYNEIQIIELKQSRELLNGIITQLPMIVTRIDQSGMITQSIGKGINNLGYKEGELNGKNIFDFFPSAVQLQKAIKGENVFYETNVTNKHNEIRHFQNYFFPEDNGALGFSIDVTEQRVAEDMVREKDYFLQKIADSSPAYIQLFDRINNTYLYSNDQLSDILGYSPQKIIEMGSTIIELNLHPDDLPMFYERHHKIENAKDGEVIESELRTRDIHGEYRWIYTRTIVLKRTREGKVWQTLSTSIDITEKKLTEEKLQQQLRIFDNALSNTLDFNFIFTQDLKIIYLNKPLIEFWKSSPDQILGKHITELNIPEHFKKLFSSQVLETIHNKKSMITETDYMDLDNKLRYFQYSYVPVINDKGEVEAVVGTAHDITEIKKVAEVQYKSIFESTNDAILIYDQTGCLVEANPAGYKMHGYTYEEMVGMNGRQFIHPDDYHIFLKFINEVKLGKHYFASLRHLRKDGSTIYIEKKGTGITFKGKAHLLAVVHDITEQKKALEALKESEDRFRTIADNIPNLAWMANAQGSILWFNKRWYEYTGTNPEQLLSSGTDNLKEIPQVLNVINQWTESIKTGRPFEIIYPIKGADGIDRHFLTRVRPVTNNSGKIVRWFGTNTDVTMQVKAEETLERKNKELIKINNDLDNFIYTASHDLKSPVSNLEGLFNIVNDEQDELMTENGREIIPLMLESVNRLKKVIHELTEIARIQKSPDEEVEMIPIEDLFKEVKISNEKEIQNFNGKIETDFSKAPVIRFSRKNLRSILYNLLNNALKYSDPEKEGLITVRTEKLNNTIELIVSDNGLGIPEKQLPKIFNMFKRYHTHVEGSGVGLYIVKRIIENAGGNIFLESEEGRGTTFRVVFNQ